HYAALGVSASSSQRDIKAAYRCLALRFHPDKNREPTAEERFKRIGAAYAVLSDQAARRQYDLTRPSGGGHGGGFSSRYRK
ncbi:DnaJ domain-containing protein, partial [Ochromonadaceae sp. CCMP2298]